MTLKSINPATEKVNKEIPSFSDEQIEAALGKAVETFVELRRTTFEQRAVWMNRAAEVLEEGKAEFGKLMTLEMGKPFKAAVGEAANAPGSAAITPSRPTNSWRTSPSRPLPAPQLHQVPAARAGPGGHAVELPLLAGVPLRGAGADGRQRRAAQARVERPAVRAGDRGHLPRGRASPRASSRLCYRSTRSRRSSPTRASRRRR